MARHHLVVSLCEHALKHSYDVLVHLTDIELAARDADAALVAETARRWGLERAVVYARALLRDLAGAAPAGLARVEARPLGWAGSWLLRLARARRWNGLSALGFLSMCRGGRAQARFVRESLAPRPGTREALASRSPGRRVRRALEMVARGVWPTSRGPGR
jgi:hypothetical protein